jgi:hypothetical protein
MQATSSTRPTSPWTGQTAYETNTKNLILWNGASWVNIANAGYKVGDTGPGGGIIFFVDRFNEHADFTYLEVAPISSHVERTWSSGFFDDETETSNFVDAPNAHRRGLGGGFQNTAEIVAVATSDSTSENAAKYCDSLTLGGQSDWYLPSISELKLAFETLYFEFFSSTAMSEYPPQLWSSTQVNDQAAWIIFGSSNAARTTATKSELYYVAPVRRF